MHLLVWLLLGCHCVFHVCRVVCLLQESVFIERCMYSYHCPGLLDFDVHSSGLSCSLSFSLCPQLFYPLALRMVIIELSLLFYISVSVSYISNLFVTITSRLFHHIVCCASCFLYLWVTTICIESSSMLKARFQYSDPIKKYVI